MQNIHVISHPLVQHKLTIMRDKETGTKAFRELTHELSQLLGYEAMRNIRTELIDIETPVAKTKSPVLAGRKLALIPILRAGLAMADAIADFVPNAKIGHIGMYRDPETHLPIEYYCKLPSDIEVRDVFVLDPMLATGGSAILAIDALKARGASNIKFVCILAAPEGIAKVQAAHPDVAIYTASIDEKLNDHQYIVPGLGDAGDRIFGTK
ncbi:MAG: uracil phosphoribosyltransferase [Burkholderiales bacterium]|jgi:uracil phosphoribosyltransferase|nr:uracil phosphoribosyltransferase [Burkholderiales bacterium]MBP9769235.1 uracil phosphoribosyltransferase [Burkholderiales bacterium]MBX9866603.1 uracil phosphoribosyltransferase [Burkholderiales bacterium]MDQ5920046.1 Uracil phosphoribosyltransferase [Pseudomonadota bacterium]HCY38791.1 uracil phosphoribosyltransferase [Neisseriales bacterium]